MAEIAANMTNGCCFEADEWKVCIADVLSKVMPDSEAQEVCAKVLEQCEISGAAEEEPEDEGDIGVDLYKGVFSLAYGSLTLLNNTRLYLKRGGNYGLLGPNDCGKTTLMRAINSEQVDGFPPKSELKTAFVEHGIGEAEPECDWSPFDYLLDEPVIKAMFDAGETNMEKMEEEGLDKEAYAKKVGLDMKGLGTQSNDAYPHLMGQCAGMIHDVKPAKEILDSMVTDATAILKRTASMARL